MWSVRKVFDLIFFCKNLVDFNDEHLLEATLNLHTHALIFSPPVNSLSWWQAPFDEVLFSALVRFSLLEKYLTIGREQPEVAGSHIRRVRWTTGVWFFAKKDWIKCEECAGDCRDGGINCLLTTTPVSCTAQHHIGSGGHPCSILWRFFDPMVHTSDVQWKSNENIKHYLTQMLLAINWRYWRTWKNSSMRMEVQGCLMQACLIEIHQVFAKRK